MNNEPAIWINDFPFPKPHDHKYSRGQVGVLGGVEMTGAACLSADGAAKIGAGLVTILSPQRALWKKFSCLDPLLVYKVFKPYIIARNDMDIHEFAAKAKSKGKVVCVIGPGLGNKEYETVRGVIVTLLHEKAYLIIDADGLNAFADYQELLFENIHAQTVLTPHEGEFKKLFPSLAQYLKNDRVKAAQKAAQQSKAVIVLKGHETVITQCGKDAVINKSATAYLATAGTGDVLSGMIAGLMAQGMEPFNAACAAVWIHGRASEITGVGLVASDLAQNIPLVLKEILGIGKKVR